MSRLVMSIPADRSRCGRALLVLGDGRIKLGPFRVLATASRRAARRHGNPRREPLRPYGHPPAGSYVVAGSLPPGFAPNAKRAKRFGRLGALLLAPERGQALDALANGRRHVYLHGGPLDRQGRLRPTLGGFRVADDDLAKLLRAMNDVYSAGDPLRSVDVIEIAPPAGAAPSPGDAVGRFKPALGALTKPPPALGGRRAPAKSAALMAVGLALLAKRGGEPPPADPARRKAIALGLMLFGGLAATACGGPDEPAPSCVACDPWDPACPPDGYVCLDDPPPADGGGSDAGDDGGGAG